MITNPQENIDKCIVTINGKNYDLSEFRKVHPGGDIYRNGEDMTDAYIANHGEDYSRITPYELDDNGKFKQTPKKIDITTKSATNIIEGSDGLKEIPKPYTLKDIDKALDEELDEL